MSCSWPSSQVYRLFLLNFLTSTYYMMAYLCLATAFGYILSHSIFVYSVFTGLYLMAMGLGAFFANRLRISVKWIVPVLLWNILIGLLVVNPALTGLMFVNELLYAVLRNTSSNYIYLSMFFGFALTVVLGLFSGCELPLFSRYLEENQLPHQRWVTRVLALDYLGTFCGVVSFALFLYPTQGLIATISWTQLFGCVFCIPLVLTFEDRNWGIVLFSFLVVVISLLFAGFQNEFLWTLDNLSF